MMMDDITVAESVYFKRKINLPAIREPNLEHFEARLYQQVSSSLTGNFAWSFKIIMP